VLVERQVELQNVETWLAEHPAGLPLGVLFDELRDDLFRHVARLGDTRNLERGGGRSDVGIKTTPRGRDEVNRDGFVVLGFELLGVALDAFDRRLAGRSKV
jgi:hypothetical protein